MKWKGICETTEQTGELLYNMRSNSNKKYPTSIPILVIKLNLSYKKIVFLIIKLLFGKYWNYTYVLLSLNIDLLNKQKYYFKAPTQLLLQPICCI